MFRQAVVTCEARLKVDINRSFRLLEIGGVLPVLDLFGRERNVFKPEGLFDSVLDAVAIPTSVSHINNIRLNYRVLPKAAARVSFRAVRKNLLT